MALGKRKVLAKPDKVNNNAEDKMETEMDYHAIAGNPDKNVIDNSKSESIYSNADEQDNIESNSESSIEEVDYTNDSDNEGKRGKSASKKKKSLKDRTKHKTGLYNEDGTLKTNVNTVGVGALRIGKSAIATAIVGIVCLGCVSGIIVCINGIVRGNTGLEEIKVDYGADWVKLGEKFNVLLDNSLTVEPTYWNITTNYNEDCEPVSIGHIAYGDEYNDERNYGYSYTLSNFDDCWETTSKYLTSGGYKEYSRMVNTPYGDYIDIDGLLSTIRYQTSTDIPNPGFIKIDSDINSLSFDNFNQCGIVKDTSRLNYIIPSQPYIFNELYNIKNNFVREPRDVVLYKDYGSIKYLEDISIPKEEWNLNLAVNMKEHLPNLLDSIINVTKEHVKDNFAVGSKEVTVLLKNDSIQEFASALIDSCGESSITDLLLSAGEDDAVTYSFLYDENTATIKCTFTLNDDKVVFTASSKSSVINTKIVTLGDSIELLDKYWVELRNALAQCAINQYISDKMEEDKEIIDTYNLEYNLLLKTEQVIAVTDENGAQVFNEDGTPVTALPKDKVLTFTDENGSVITEIEYKEINVITDENGLAINEIILE